MRIGYGFDIHAFGGVGPITIGGVTIPYEKGILSHSDGDVVIHSLVDAFLGAAALGDIGVFFPNTDQAFKGIDSRVMLRIIWEKVQLKGYTIGNIDITIIAQSPMIMTYMPQMKVFLSDDLSCQQDTINIKATTTEKLGFIGREEGIACNTVILVNDDNIQKKSSKVLSKN